MNSRERFLRTLEFGAVDFGFNHELGLWGQTFDRWWAEGMPRDMHVGDLIRGCAYFGLERIEYLGLNVMGMLPPFEEEVLEEDERYIVKRHADGSVTRALKEGTAHGTRMSMDQHLSHPVTDRTSWEDARRRYNPLAPARFPAWWADVQRCLAGRDYPLALTHNGCFGLYSFLRRLMGTELACIIFYDDPVLAEEILDYVTDYLIELTGPALKQLQFDYFNFFEDFAGKGGPLVSPRLFRKFLMPRYRRVIDHLHAHGVRHIWLDSDGDTRVLIPLFIEMGVTVHWPLERAAGMDPVEVRGRYGHALGLAGGIDKRELTKDFAAIDAELERIAPLVEDGGFIPTLDHAVPPDIPYMNWLYYLKRKARLLGVDPGTIPALRST
jgi:uroporphyrinogen decarboxylase